MHRFPPPYPVISTGPTMLRNLSLPSLFFVIAMTGTAILASAVIASDGPDFRTQIQPILAEHCSQCHGVDESTREGGLRLDVRGAALLGGDSGNAAIAPGHADQSELVRRILSSDPDEVMPPPSLKKPLSDLQKKLLQQWIDAGAGYEEHWAFVPPQASQVDLSRPVRGEHFTNPLDWLIADTLDRKGWKPSGPAESWELCRRIYLDIIGVPPTPEQLQAFSTDGLEATIDRLLADERYGEKWARPWLDVARYSDTNGYEKDLQREQWAWRDWVIDAINRDMPYDQFVIEQIAGDLLPQASQEQRIATGFLRNSMINEEGAIVPEQFRMVEMFDRMDCVGKAVLGLSLQCAQCHSHKFDPITHDEYYGLFASLNNSYEARSWVYTPEQQATIRQVEQSIEQEYETYRRSHPDWRAGFSQWRQSILATQPQWQPLHAELLETISGLNHPVQEADESILMLGHTSNDVFMIAPTQMDRITGLRFEVLTHGELPFRGPGRNGVGQWDLKELELLVQRPGIEAWEKVKLVSATADFSNAEEKSADGKIASGPVEYLIDGKDETSWKSDRGLGRRNQSSVAVLQLESALENLRGSKLKIVWRQGDMVGCCRISVTDSLQPTAPSIDHDAMLDLATSESNAQASDGGISPRSFYAWMKSQDDAKALVQNIESHWKLFPNAKTSVLHMAEREPARSRPTYTLQRGNWDQPLAPARPIVLTSFHAPEAQDDPPRLKLAKWLVDRNSPLTARVAVNRVWHNIFGEGLVETAEDFGTRAPIPEHQAVLDTLAVEWMNRGWSQKQLVKSILMTAAYQRSSAASPELLEVDPRNRWLTRGPRFRCDAESIRDIVLSAAGLLHHRVGGPSVIPPVPQNVLDYNYTYPSYWTAAAPPERYRRAVYMFRKRSMPDPVLNVFDAPNGDVSCARRMRSNTPLSALTALNEPVFFEAAQGLAMRLLKEVPETNSESQSSDTPSDLRRLHRAFLLTTSRLPSPAEEATVMEFLESQRKRLADGWLNPREILTGDPAKLVELPGGATPQDAAAWTLTSRVILNLDATVSK